MHDSNKKDAKQIKTEEACNVEKLSGKVRALVIAGIVAVVVLAAAGGGEVVGQEIDQEGLWNEYSFDITNGDTWYEVEVNAFGKVTGLESGQGGYGTGHWD